MGFAVRMLKVPLLASGALVAVAMLVASAAAATIGGASASAMEIAAPPVAVMLAGTLVVAGSSKLFGPHQFASSIVKVLDRSQRVALIAARGVGVVELGAAVLMSIPVTRSAGAAVGGLVGLGIVGWVAVVAGRRVTVSCGCFGGNSAKPLDRWNAIAGVTVAAASGGVLITGSLGSVPAAADQLVAEQLALTALAALALVLAFRFRDFAPKIGKGFGYLR